MLGTSQKTRCCLAWLGSFAFICRVVLTQHVVVYYLLPFSFRFIEWAEKEFRSKWSELRSNLSSSGDQKSQVSNAIIYCIDLLLYRLSLLDGMNGWLVSFRRPWPTLITNLVVLLLISQNPSLFLLLDLSYRSMLLHLCRKNGTKLFRLSRTCFESNDSLIHWFIDSLIHWYELGNGWIYP